jgi:hypothetical protein
VKQVTKKRIQPERPHPSAVPFVDFLIRKLGEGEAVGLECASEWVMASYRRESLVRSGARWIVYLAGKRSGKTSRTTRRTRAAADFCERGAPLERQDELYLYSVGVRWFTQRMMRGGSGFMYDRTSGKFSPRDVAHRFGLHADVMSAVSSSLSSTRDIASRCGRSFSNTSHTLTDLKKQGLVVCVGKGSRSLWRKTDPVEATNAE